MRLEEGTRQGCEAENEWIRVRAPARPSDQWLFSLPGRRRSPRPRALGGSRHLEVRNALNSRHYAKTPRRCLHELCALAPSRFQPPHIRARSSFFFDSNSSLVRIPAVWRSWSFLISSGMLAPPAMTAGATGRAVLTTVAGAPKRRWLSIQVQKSFSSFFSQTIPIPPVIQVSPPVRRAPESPAPARFSTHLPVPTSTVMSSGVPVIWTLNAWFVPVKVRNAEVLRAWTSQPSGPPATCVS